MRKFYTAILAISLGAGPSEAFVGQDRCAMAQQLSYTYIYQLKAYSPSRGAVGSKEIAVVSSDFQSADFQASLIQQNYLVEVAKGEIGVVVTRTLISAQ